LNFGSTKMKEIVGLPWRVAFALSEDGWYLRQDIVWAKPNPMPESVTDRCTKAHEYLFLLTKSPKYRYNHEEIKEPATKEYRGRTLTLRNKRSVWTIAPQPFKDAHFAVMPEALVEPCILAGSAEGDTVLDPFSGSGTVGVVALRNGRNYIGCELNPEYAAMSEARLRSVQGRML
ncbi:MAG TPA: site-specific DNA-methyltransferase, partial [Acidimicrobiia bacterium]